MPWEVAAVKSISNASVPTGALTPYQTALGKVKTTPVVIMGLGASGTGGSASTDILTKAYLERHRAAMVTKGYSIHGDTDLVTRSVKFSPNEAQSTPIFVHDISPAAWVPTGPFHIASYAATGVSLATPQFHYTHPTVARGFRGRSFRVWVWSYGNQDGGPTPGGQTFQFNVNGGAAQTFTHSSTNDNKLVSFDITSATPGWADQDNQVINFGNQSALIGGLTALTVVAISSYSSTTVPGAGVGGLHYSHFGYAGCCLGDLFAWGGNNPADKLAQIIGTTSGAAPFAIDTTKTPPWGPDLLIIDMFDDVVAPNSAVPLASTPATTVQLLSADGYLHGLRALRSAALFKPTGCTIGHHIMNLPVGPTTDIGFPGALHLENAEAFQAAHRTAAGIQDLILDSEAEWTGHGLALTAQASGNAHPSDNGHSDSTPYGIASRMISRWGI